MQKLVHVLVLACLLFNGTQAAICLIPFLCSSSITETTTIGNLGRTSSAVPSLSSSSSIAISSVAIIMTSEAPVTTTARYSSSLIPTLSPTSTLRSTRSAVITVPTSTLSDLPLPTATSSTTAEEPEPSQINKIPIIIGSVCGFVVLLMIGFAYAFFSKTKKNKKKRIYSETEDMCNYGRYDILNNSSTRDAPTSSQWTEQQQQHYGYIGSPHVPLENHYYNGSPQMSNINSNYYNQPNNGLYHPHFQQQISYSPQQPTNIRTIDSDIYSPPNSYDHDVTVRK